MFYQEKADSTSIVTEASIAGGGHGLSGRDDRSCFLVAREEMQEKHGISFLLLHEYFSSRYFPECTAQNS